MGGGWWSARESLRRLLLFHGELGVVSLEHLFFCTVVGLVLKR